MGHPFVKNTFAPCPPDLLARARGAGPVNMLVVQAGASLPMQSAFDAYKAGIATPILIGDTSEIAEQAKTIGWDISNIETIQAIGEQDSATSAVSCLQSRGILSADNPDGIGAILKGQLHTDVFMGALLQRDAGVRIGNRLVHVFAIYPDNGPPLLVSDAAVNVAPDVKTQQQSLIEMQRLIEALGHGPAHIAILSATETPIESVPSSLAAAELALWAKETMTGAQISGPLSLDLALSEASVAIKGIGDDLVAGRANALHVPDLVSGNILYKSLVYFGGGCAAGLVMGGALPILLTSRADPPSARLASVALAAILQRA